jgi:hypothetical protein
MSGEQSGGKLQRDGPAVRTVDGLVQLAEVICGDHGVVLAHCQARSGQPTLHMQVLALVLAKQDVKPATLGPETHLWHLSS